MLDTAIDLKHPALRGVISSYVSTSYDGHLVPDPERDENPVSNVADHGTFVAGLLAGRGVVDRPPIGVAPDARLACAEVLEGGSVSRGCSAAWTGWRVRVSA